MDRILRVLQRLALNSPMSSEAAAYIAALERLAGIGEPTGDDATFIYNALRDIILSLPRDMRRNVLSAIAGNDPEFYLNEGLHGITREADAPSQYLFVLRAGGEGNTWEEAWEDARYQLETEGLGDPAFYFPTEYLDIDLEDDPIDPIAMQHINQMDRDDIIIALESVGIACYDHESTDMLRDALIDNVADGTIQLP